MSFLTQISFNDLLRLREVVRKVHMTYYRDHQITPHEMDKLIEALGPEILEAELKNLVDGQAAANVNGTLLVPSDLPDKKEGEIR
jgi:hypothetical protein